MSGGPSPAPDAHDAATPSPGRALAATLAIQMYTSLAAAAGPVLAPELGRDLGIAPKWVGVFIGLTYAGAMIASLVSGGLIRRYGAIRVSQVCVAVCATGIAIVAVVPPAALPLLVVAAIGMGLGYGPITPASSHVLARTTPASRMSLVFSIKQTGVPAGTALAGALLPGLALTLGWRGACVGVAIVGIVVCAAAQSMRAPLDADRRPDAPISVAGAFAPLAIVFRHRALTELTLISCAYAAVQVSLTTFLVVYLTEALQWTLVSAGFALTAATVGGVVGRIGWGALADRTRSARVVLATIGLLAGACATLMALAGPQWPVATVVILSAIFGATAIGWNGVQLAELARQAPAGQVGLVTGAGGFVTFAGVVAGPPLFAALAGITGSYSSGFALAAIASIGGALAILTLRR